MSATLCPQRVTAYCPRAVAQWLANQNPSTDQFGRQKIFDAGAKTPSRPKRINNRSPTTDNIQKNILRPLTTNSRTKIVSGSKKVGDRSLRDHANTLAVCNCYIICKRS